MDLSAPAAEQDQFYRGGQAETIRHYYIDWGGTETEVQITNFLVTLTSFVIYLWRHECYMSLYIII